jgi:hypothetical protein
MPKNSHNKVIAICENNLCITKRIINSSKGKLNENDFKK